LVADSFQGVPGRDLDKYPADSGKDLFKYKQLAVPLDTVKRNFEWYEMLDDRVVFLPGWFRDTLPAAAIKSLALIRLDGDLHESTMEGLKYLYPKLSTGGFVKIVDYHCVPAAEQATDDFRREQGLTEEVVKIDWSAVYWKRGSFS
jgi:O-methyltransferase